MATLGFADLKDTALPSLWDASEIAKVRLAEGRTFDRLLAEVQQGMGMLSRELLDMPHYGDLFAVQDTVEVEYPIGASNGFAEATEYGVANPQRGATSGHSIPLKPYDRALGWTGMYLRNARATKLDADIRSAITDAKSLFQQKLLSRFFLSTGETVGSTANASVPFVDAAATDTTYCPPASPEGETFLTTHTHLLRVDAITQANLNTAVEHLQEHGHKSPFELIVARADIGSWTNKTNVTGYKNPEWPGIVYHSSATERAAVPEVSEYIGYVETDYGICRIWATPRVPTLYWGLYKNYGPGDPRNPLRVRINPNFGFGYQLVPGNWINAPSQLAVAYTEFGVGVGEDRTNGVLVYTYASGSYTSPTIS